MSTFFQKYTSCPNNTFHTILFNNFILQQKGCRLLFLVIIVGTLAHTFTNFFFHNDFKNFFVLIFFQVRSNTDLYAYVQRCTCNFQDMEVLLCFFSCTHSGIQDIQIINQVLFILCFFLQKNLFPSICQEMFA